MLSESGVIETVFKTLDSLRLKNSVTMRYKETERSSEYHTLPERSENLTCEKRRHTRGGMLSIFVIPFLMR